MILHVNSPISNNSRITLKGNVFTALESFLLLKVLLFYGLTFIELNKGLLLLIEGFDLVNGSNY